MFAGWLTIGTKVDNSKFDKQIKDLEKKITEAENKAAKQINIKASKQQELEKEKENIANLMVEYDKLIASKKKFLQLEKIQAKHEIGTPEYQKANLQQLDYAKQIGATDTGKFTKIEKMQEKITLATMKQEALKHKIEETDNVYKDMIERVKDYKNQINNINLNKHKEDLVQAKNSLGGVGSSIQNAIHKVSKLALGVFGIRSAFLAVRRASSELASYNPQYSANLEYIRYALTQLIAPVLEYIVNLAKTLLAYINYIANAWFGVNLFAKASAKSFNQVKKNIGGASSAAKELKKTLAGFDEMNILNSNSTGGGGGVGGGAIGPDFDLSDLDAVEIPEWIKWIANNKDIVIGAIKGIAMAFLIFKTLKIAQILSGVSGSLLETIKGLTTFRKFLLGAGIAAIIVGIVYAFESLLKFLKEPTWNNFRGVLDGLSIALVGLGVALLAINSSNPFGWVAIAIAVIAQLVKLIGDLVTKHDEEARKAEIVKKAEENLKEAREKLSDATSHYIDAVEKAEDAEKKLKEAQEETGISIDDLLDKMDKENLSFKDLNENERKVYKAYVNNTNAQNNLKNSTEEVTDAQNQQREELFKTIAAYQQSSSNVTEYKNNVVKAYNEGKLSSKEAADAIGVALANMDDKTRKSFTKDIPDAIKQGLNPSQYNAVANSFKNWWTGILNQLQSSSSGITRSIGNSFANMLSQMKSLNYSGSFKVADSVTKMASGGIINMPNRGVPVANAIAGEAGHEGIIPLTDQQAMAQLGAEIGRNVLVNLTNITSMNGRVISRELKILQGEQNFAYNM